MVKLLKRRLKEAAKKLKAKRKPKTQDEQQLEDWVDLDFIRVFADTLAPRPTMTVDMWADKYRILPSVSAHEEGLWRTSRFPFLKRVMQLLSPTSDVEQIAVMKGAQLGFTECALNWMFFIMDYDPAPTIYMQKTEKAVLRFVKQRLEPAIAEMPIIRNKIGKGHAGKGSGNTQFSKSFPGGILELFGANSGTNLRSMPAKYIIADEPETYEEIRKEGSSLDIIKARSQNFPGNKMFYLSTPTIKETSIIEPLFDEGTQERYNVPCPFCKTFQVIYWKNIIYEQDKKTGRYVPGSVYLECIHCKGKIKEQKKTWMLERGKWIADNPGADYPSFHISSLYAPYGFAPWPRLVKRWIKAQRSSDIALLKSFINTVLGETFSESGDIIKASYLEQRREEYQAEVPKDVVLLTCGVDIQTNRIEGEVVGWTRDLQTYSIDYSIFMGNPEFADVWGNLDMWLMKRWKHANGFEIPIAIAAIDSGYKAKLVYEFCKAREHRNIFPVKGVDAWGKTYIKRSQRKNEHGVHLYLVYTDEVKSRIYSNLSIDVPGPGFCHFPVRPEYDSVYFNQLLAERLVTKFSGGRNRVKYELITEGRRNEALDCRVYNVAALQILKPQFDLLPANKVYYAGTQQQKTQKRRIHSRGF